jgi:hypothetical protein
MTAFPALLAFKYHPLPNSLVLDCKVFTYNYNVLLTH